MSTFEVARAQWEFNRGRTLATLDEIAGRPDAAAVLAFRPGPGRAPVAWQFLHVGVTEELFATERLIGTQPAWPDLVPRFKGGSTPDDDIPAPETIRTVLGESRRHLLETMSRYTDADLEVRPPAFAQRGWTMRNVLQVLSWHEPHHQGQIHLSLNLWKAAHP